MLSNTEIVYTQPRALSASIEATPKQVASADGLVCLLPAGTRIYLTDLGTDTAETLLAAAVRVRALGYEPVPHMAVRRIADRHVASEQLARLAGEAGVTDVLIIGGGVRKPAGPFAASIDFLATGILDSHGITSVGVAGHPEGSPDITPAAVEEALHLKVAFAERTGADLRIVTQFGFDPESACRWIQSLADAGLDIPVHLGVAGPAKISTLLKYSAMCGVGPSLGFLKNRAGALAALTTSYSPGAFVEPVERWHAATPGTLLAGIHVFPFGGLAQSANWLVERGSIHSPIGGISAAQSGGLS